MNSGSCNSQKGAAGVKVVVTIGIILVVVYGLYRIVRWLWHVWPHFTGGVRWWWHLRVADPIFQLMVKAISASHDNVLIAIGLVALGSWVFIRCTAGLSLSAIRTADTQRQKIPERVVGQMEDIHAKLKKLFADDLEKIALFGGLSGEKAETAHGDTRGVGPTGCLVGIGWMLIAWPLSFVVGLAIYDGVVRLFSLPDSTTSLLASAGTRAAELGALLPLAKTASIAGLVTVNLGARSLLLTLVAGFLGFLLWLLNSISNSGWTFPRVIDSSPLLAYLITLGFTYMFLTSALLIFACWSLTYSILAVALSKFVLRSQMLRIRAFLR